MSRCCRTVRLSTDHNSVVIARQFGGRLPGGLSKGGRIPETHVPSKVIAVVCADAIIPNKDAITVRE